MNPVLSPYVLIMITAGVICAGIAASVWLQHRDNSETIPLVFLLAGIIEWIAATLGGILDPDLSHKMLWAQIEYIGVVSVPLMVLVYVLHHSGSRRQLSAARLAWLALIPAATLVLAWTNGSHGWIWARYVPHLENGLTISEKTYGPGFWIYWAYSYLILLAATIITVRAMIPTANIFRRQNLLILSGILAPWIGNVLSVLRLAPLKNLDLTPLAFSVTGTMLALGMFRWRLFDIKPIAQAAVIAGMADGVLILDEQGRIVEANPAAQEILELGAQAMIGNPLQQILAGRLAEGERFSRLEEKSIGIQLIHGVENRDYELSRTPFHEKSGSPGGWIVFLRDLTDRKRLEATLREVERKHAEDLLRQSENKYATLFQNMSVGVMYQAPGGEVIDMNPAAERILGVERGRLSGLESIRANLKTIHEDGSDYPAEEHPSFVALKTGKPLRNQRMGIAFPDEKTCRWINIHAVPQFHPGDDKPYQVFVIFDDVTERKQAEEALRALSTRQTALLSAVPDIIMEVNNEKIYTWANRAGFEFFGEDVIGREAADYFWGEQKTYETVKPLFRGGEDVIYLESWQRRKDGEKRLLTWWCRVLKDEQGEVTGALSSASDITELKKVEEALRESEEKFKYVFDNSSVGKSITAPTGEAQMNKAFCEMLGYSPEELQKIRWQDISHPEDVGSTQKEVDSLVSGQKSAARFTKRYLHKNGSVVWADVSTSLRRDGQGKPLYFMTTVIDITARKQAEESLRDSETRLRAILDSTPFPIALVDLQDNKIDFWSRSALDLFGHTAPTAAEWYEIAYPDPDYRREVIERWKTALEMARQSPQAINAGEFRVTCRDGSVRICELYAGFLADRLIVTFNDITERKQAEESLRDSEQRLRRVYDSGLVGIIYWNMEGQIVDANDKFLELVGYTRDDLSAGRIDWSNMTPPEFRYLDEASVVELKATGVNKVPFEKEYIRKDGSRLPILLAGAMLDEARFNGVAYVLNITDRKRAEEALQITLTDLERSNAELEQFAYVASHDLQEPLRMVSSFTQLLGQRYMGKLDKDADEFIAYAVDGANQMQRLINDLLAYSRVGTRGKPPAPVPADLALDRALENLKLAVEEGQAEVKREPLPTVTVDDIQLIQVFQNLIANAIKFRGEDPPRIQIAAEARGKEWVFSVRDNGIGIDPQYLERIFIIFQRLHKRGQYPGTGIGLAMCKRIIVRHGGRIWVESEPGKGSTFFFTLPKTGG
jgi:PAS domain S-box-containing protein